MARFCNAIYWWAAQRVEDVAKFDFELDKPTIGRVKQSDIDRELDDFSSFMTAFGG